MCGLCGIVSLGRPLGPPDEALVGRMADAMRHRGPDDRGVVAARQGVIGATRLSIRGLTSGRQPMVDEATGVVVACNGEIDNHRELRRFLESRGRTVRQDTDVAVLPGLYVELGDAFVERLVGPFAVAVFDPRQPRLLLARDAAGERPLHVARDASVPGGSRLVFASEIRALLLALPEAEPDRAALGRYLARGCFVSPDSPVKGVRRLGPGEVLTFSAAGETSRRFWSFRPGTVDGPPPTEREFLDVFTEAVRRQEQADVPVGVFLSGGLDSSLVGAAIRRVRPTGVIHATSLRFREGSFDEGVHAERVARLLSLELSSAWTGPEDVPGVLAAMVATSGEPLADPAWIPTALLARRAAQDMRVALAGEGGDELFGGYPTYAAPTAVAAFMKIPRPARAVLRRLLTVLPASEKKMTVGSLLLKLMEGAEQAPFARHLAWTASVPPAILTRLGVTPEPVPEPAVSRSEILDVLQAFDTETTLADGLLTKADRAAMAVSLELRAPFLDRDVMTLAARLPPSERVDGIETKAFLKRAALAWLPRDIVYRRKRGLSVPLAAWLRRDLGDWAASRLAGGALEEAGLSPAVARTLLEEHAARKADHARAIWTLLVLCEWQSWFAEARRGSHVAAAETLSRAAAP